ncbi:Uncharacterized protein dnm_094150 [Desulfonema magnum]|uniref:Uncharacterized protein n=1 Tax=Desulfonema magnum TaxID=45655 RepID=A0A975GV25_9BACT|nr:Uncharacterized protein dnm_094150 [Desulfonema magnum]
MPLFSGVVHLSGDLIYNPEFYINEAYMTSIKNMQALKNNNSNCFLRNYEYNDITYLI